MNHLQKLARVLIEHSTRLKKGEKVLIEAFDVPHALIAALITEVKTRGATPIILPKSNVVLRHMYREYAEDDFRFLGELEALWMARMDAYIGVRGNKNICELSDVPSRQMRMWEEYVFRPVHRDIRLKTKWVVLRYPNFSMAQQAGMSTKGFRDFYFDVCTMDYGRMSHAMEALTARMQNTNEVVIYGPDTELTFSIKGIPVIACGGEHNIPDGECFTAPVKYSVNGRIRFNTPTIYRGIRFHDIRLNFHNGQIVEATASSKEQTRHLDEILGVDEEARYVGEFGIGLNPHIRKPMLDILFDEKIAGSFHFTPGSAYPEADNGNNKSQIHWDMVMIQMPEYGGGQILFDGELIRDKGMFVTSDLMPLNPENLAK